MSWLRRLRAQPWQIVSASVGGLLIGIALAGLVGFALNERVRHVTERALEYDVELEDRGDDLRVAVLDLRHYHRNILFSGPSRRAISDFDGAYLQLGEQIARLERLGIADPRVPQADQLRGMAESYYSSFRPAIDLYHDDPETFTRANDDGLIQLAELEAAARDIDHLGEQRAAASLKSVDRASESARAVLLAVLSGLVLMGAGLAYSTVSMVRHQQQTARQLSQALRAKTDFIADASHELRTPLTVLRANAEVALELDRTCIHTELLEEIVQESERMTRLVEDLLLLARADAASLPLELDSVSVAPFLAALAERAGVLVRERGASLQAQLSAEGWARIDRSRVEQVVLILVDNATKYSPPGQPVTLASRTKEGKLVVEVSDRGPGIPEADLPFVFERFYRVDKARARRHGGAGLGLAIAKTIVEGHGGRIEAQSQVGRGTTMRFYLPLADDSPPSRTRAERATAGEVG